MSFECPFCIKEFKNPTWLTNHVKKKHAAQVRLQLQNGELEKLKLNIIAHKIIKTPDFFNIPLEYLGVFNTIA